ncbi:biotin transporter BioY [Vallitalea okinawensis]|uniref:biotin transporter BioY n=1 Tax=Vallitalea okinawensis TaxID=2078660 RepID=UPI001FA938E0|nr:biotin transporter BioY [Vallitalea okinawensis]
MSTELQLILAVGAFIIMGAITVYNMYKADLNPKNIILVGLFAALTAVGAWIKIPLPYVPFTMQLFFCIMSGLLLGSRLGMLSQLIYVIIGLIGVPVFASGGGIYYIFTPTFGYLIGFILGAYVAGKIIELKGTYTFKWYIIASLIAMIVIYITGVPYLYMAKNLFVGAEFSIMLAIQYGFLVSVGGDILSCILLSSITLYVRAGLIKSNLI